MRKRIRNVLIILLGSVAAGALLLVLAYCLPVESARAHVEESLYEMLEVAEDPDGNELRKKIIGFKDNFTDCLMVQNALERVEGKNPWEHAMYAYHYDLGNESTWMTEKSLAAFLRQGSDGMYLREYSRYWHGYLVYLKPLLICMSWRNVETLLLVFQVLLLLAVLVLSCCRKNPYLGLGIVCTFLFMKPLGIWFSLTLSDCWTIALAAVLVMLLFYDRLEKRSWHEELFLLTGILTAYVDFLTYPVVTLGVPLCAWLVLRPENCGGSRRQLSGTFWNCACWGVGYVGMWGFKWVLAELTCRTGTLRNAVWAVIFRTEPLDGYGSAFTGISRTFRAVLNQYDSAAYGVGFGIIAAMALVSVVLCLVRARSAGWAASVVCLAFAALLPFGWLAVTQNHTAIHCDYTFRIAGVTVMALCCITVCSVQAPIRKAKVCRDFPSQ